MSQVNKQKPEGKQKQPHPYIISKRVSTQFNHKVPLITSEEHDSVFAVCGNQILQYSLTTGILVNTLRSKRQQLQQDSKTNSNIKGDVHKANIVALYLIDSKVIYPIKILQLISLCSKGVLAEWDAAKGALINQYELKNCGKIKFAVINNEHIVTYDSQQKIIKVFDCQTKSIKHTYNEFETPGKVNQITISSNILVYIKGRSAIIHDLQDKSEQPRQIQRDSLLRTVALNERGNLLALGDDFGKIYIVHNFNSKNQRNMVVQTLHWHSHQVNCLRFMTDSPFLLSVGIEGVIVQWHLETQNRTFISRVGNEILNINLSITNSLYYSMILKDNSIKVVRFDNNKTIFNQRNLRFSDQPADLVHNQLLVADLSDLLFNDLVQGDQRSVQTLRVKNRNYVSQSEDEKAPQTQIKSFCLTSDQKTLVTFEELADQNAHKDIKIQVLKFWYREAVSSDVNDFQLTQIVNDPCLKHKNKFIIQEINNKSIAIANGEEIQIWSQNNSQNWSINFSFNYQESKVLQLIPNIKIRVKHSDKFSKCLAVLHKGGQVSYWDQDNFFTLCHTFKLNNHCHKIIYESSFRFLAGLTHQGSVEVWKIKGSHEKHWWDLNFKSVKDILNNSQKENQFIVTMNSEDDQTKLPDSVLLFQFSRPQNLMMYWKCQLPFMKVINCDISQVPHLLIINKNQELQRIYFGANQSDLKQVAQKRRLSMEQHVKEGEEKSLKKLADYSFIEQKPEQPVLAQTSSLLTMTENTVKRLDNADKIVKESEFLSMPSLGFCFDQFVNEMLYKPPKNLNSLIDLQEEITKSQKHRWNENQDEEMRDEQHGSAVYDQVDKELQRMFENLFKK